MLDEVAAIAAVTLYHTTRFTLYCIKFCFWLGYKVILGPWLIWFGPHGFLWTWITNQRPNGPEGLRPLETSVVRPSTNPQQSRYQANANRQFRSTVTPPVPPSTSSSRRTNPQQAQLTLSTASHQVQPALPSNEQLSTSSTVLHKPRCGTCYRSFITCESLRRHQTGINHTCVSCTCSRVFESIPRLESHISRYSAYVTSDDDQISSQKSSLTCSVCLNYPQTIMATGCGHLFCKACIMQAIAIRRECPACRRYVAIHELRNIYI